MLYTACLLTAAICSILLLSARLKWNPFFVLLLVSAGVGVAAGLSGDKIISLLKVGLGGTIEKIGLLIVLGTTLGILLEKSGATHSLARAVLARTGQQNAPLALSLIGFVVGLPIFCDSGFIVLSGLAVSLAAQMPARRVWLVLSLATALYAVHCLVPPHPGITAAAGLLGVDIGKGLIWGIPAAILPAIVGYFWAKRQTNNAPSAITEVEAHLEAANTPKVAFSALPILLPVALIALKSTLALSPAATQASWYAWMGVLGDPIVALLAGILSCVPLLRGVGQSQLNEWIETALVKSGTILLVTAAGGAFGEVIKALQLGQVFGEAFAQSGLGLLIPFGLAALFKSAQGSSTVAVMATAGILGPLLSSIQLDTEAGRLCALLAAGAGSMAASHTNDSYFWVISRFGGVSTNHTLRGFSLASLLMALAGLASTYIVYLIHYK